MGELVVRHLQVCFEIYGFHLSVRPPAFCLSNSSWFARIGIDFCPLAKKSQAYECKISCINTQTAYIIIYECIHNIFYTYFRRKTGACTRSLARSQSIPFILSDLYSSMVYVRFTVLSKIYFRASIVFLHIICTYNTFIYYYTYIKNKTKTQNS